MDTSNERDELYVADCRIRTTAELISHSWDIVVLAALREGSLRRRELRREIGGISDKVLTDALNRLLRWRLLSRRATAEVPPRVDYALTEQGASLVDGPIMAMGQWAIEHADFLAELPND